MSETRIADNEEMIADGIRYWYCRWANDPNKWTRSPIARAMKEVLQRTGNWKNAPRGNPRKGYEASRSHE